MSRFLSLFFLACSCVSLATGQTNAILERAAAAEVALEPRRALELYYEALRAAPDDAFILQKIARQYSDLVEDQRGPEEKKRYAQTALDYALRAVALEPDNPVNVLSLAICHGRLATYSDTRTKVKYSRLIKEEAERALALDPDYAWAHHVLGRWHHEVAALGRTARFFVTLFYGGLPEASSSEAINHLERAAALEPDVIAHRVELGIILHATGQLERARTELERGLALPAREKHDVIVRARAQAVLAEL